MPRYCCVPNCTHARGFARGFSFPKDPELSRQWIVAINPHRESLWKPSRAALVCHAHFKPEDYKVPLQSLAQVGGKARKDLKKGAVPSVFPWNADANVGEEEPVDECSEEQDFNVPIIPKVEITEFTDPLQPEESNEVAEEVQRPYPCPKCSAILHSFAEVCNHLRTFHYYEKEVFHCRLCRLSTTTREDWFSHYSKCLRYKIVMLTI